MYLYCMYVCMYNCTPIPVLHYVLQTKSGQGVVSSLSSFRSSRKRETTGQAGAQTQFLSRTLPWKAA